MKSNKLFLLVMVLLLAGLAACSPAAPPEPAVTNAPASNFPVGKFIDQDDRFRGFYFNEDSTWIAIDAGEHVAKGTYSVNGDLYIEETNDQDCPAPMSYQYSFDGTNLTFQLTEASKADTCQPRIQGFNGKTYVLQAASLPEITIDAADFAYTAPSSLNAGWVRVRLTNSGAEPHHVQFLRLNDGITIDQFEEALKQGEGPALAMVQQVGGVGAIDPTQSAQAVLNLPAGQYVILCFIPSSADQVAHHEKGMLKSLTVLATSSATANEPAADLTVRLRDFSFDLPDELPAGQMAIKVTNDGPEPHEFNIMRLADGKTADDVAQFLAAPNGPPPFTAVGGMNGLDIGLSGYAEFDFEPGTYVAICNIPSPKAEGHPHSALGMLQQFTVAEKQTTQLTSP